MTRRTFGFSALLLGLSLALSASAQESPSGSQGDIPKVYVATGNSFVVSVPNLTRVAVGNPTAIVANVVSPTEVLVEGRSEVAQEADGVINYDLSALYVWSGDKRYVYQVFVIEDSDDTALPPGVSRAEVTPTGLVLFGLSADMERTSLSIRGLRAAGVTIESRVEELDLQAMMIEAKKLEPETVADAIARGMVLEGMTTEEMLQAKGPPVLTPTMQMGDGSGGTRSKIETYEYPEYSVQVVDGFVVDISSHVSPSGAFELESVVGSSGARQTRVYRLKYAESQEVVALVRNFLSSNGKFVSQEYLRIVIVEDDLANVQAIDQVMRLIDAPHLDNGISVVRTHYIEGVVPGGGATGAEIAVVRYGNMLDNATKSDITGRLRTMGDRVLEEWVTLSGSTYDFRLIDIDNAVILIGPTGILDVLLTYIAQNFITVTNADIQRIIENRGIIQGMTKDQVEISIGERPLGAPRRLATSYGLLWEFQYPSYFLRFKNDQLFQILTLPTEEELKVAKDSRMLLWGLSKSRVDEILGEEGKSMPIVKNSATASENFTKYNYSAGEALFAENRLEEFVPSPNANVIVPGNLMPVAGSAGMGNIFTRLDPEERRRLIDAAVVMPGMSLADVDAVFRNAPPTFVDVAVGDNGRVTWTYSYPGQSITVVNGLVTAVDKVGQDRMVTEIVRVMSRNVTEILSLVTSAFYTEPAASSSSSVAPSASSVPANASINSDSSSNTLIIHDELQRITEIIKFVRELDRETTRQVLIEAKFVEINRNALSQLGVQWGISTQSDKGNQPTASFGTEESRTNPDIANTQISVEGGQPYTVSGDAGMMLGIFGANGLSLSGLRYTDIDFMISALETRGDAEVLSSPRIMTLNNQNAVLRNTDKVFDVYTTRTSETSSGGFTTSSITTTPVEQEVGITLNVTPTIGQDGVISLVIDAQVSRVTAERTFGDINLGSFILLNEIAERQSQSQVRIRSGTTLVIGGLSSKTAQKDIKKVPFLGDLPWIGKLFRTERITNRNTDLLIFLTARLVPSDGSVSEVDKILVTPRPAVPNPRLTTERKVPVSSAAAP